MRHKPSHPGTSILIKLTQAVCTVHVDLSLIGDNRNKAAVDSGARAATVFSVRLSFYMSNQLARHGQMRRIGDVVSAVNTKYG